MRYGKDIVKRIISELEKLPSVRHVCNKVGIDHSTFYRWMVKHFEFHQAVESALLFGRKNINDAAEGVIISGIQKGDFKSATYWLSRNDERYVDQKNARYFQYIDYWNKDFLKGKTPDDSRFEKLFERYFFIEQGRGAEYAKRDIEPLLDVVCHTDPNLKDLFYSAYDEWRTNRLDFERKMKKAGAYDDTEQNIDNPDQSETP